MNGLFGQQLALNSMFQEGVPQPGQPAQMPNEGQPAQYPQEGRPATMPNEGQPAQMPQPGAPAEMPQEGRPAEMPGQQYSIGEPLLDKYINMFIGTATV